MSNSKEAQKVPETDRKRKEQDQQEDPRIVSALLSDTQLQTSPRGYVNLQQDTLSNDPDMRNAAMQRICVDIT